MNPIASRQPRIIDAACDMIVCHGTGAAAEAEKRAQFLEGSSSARAAMLWKQVAISIRTIEYEMARGQ